MSSDLHSFMLHPRVYDREYYTNPACQSHHATERIGVMRYVQVWRFWHIPFLLFCRALLYFEGLFILPRFRPPHYRSELLDPLLVVRLAEVFWPCDFVHEVGSGYAHEV